MVESHLVDSRLVNRINGECHFDHGIFVYRHFCSKVFSIKGILENAFLVSGIIDNGILDDGIFGQWHLGKMNIWSRDFW